MAIRLPQERKEVDKKRVITVIYTKRVDHG